jgi:glycosyltransferase involved in cell wall biosynthesis
MTAVAGFAPPVSIIIPSYNYARYLPEAVESVLAQTHADWELLIVDDGSTDASARIARDHAVRDDRIRCLHHADERRHGIAATLLLGLQQARHDIAAFLEADDAWEPEALARRLELMREPGTALVFHAPRLCVAEGRVAEYSQYIMQILEKVVASRNPPRVFAHELAVINLIPTFSCVMADKKMLLECDFATPIAPLLDKWIWQQMAVKGACRFLPLLLTRWRLHTESFMYAGHKDEGPRELGEWRARTLAVLSPLLRGEQGAWPWAAVHFPALWGLGVRIVLKARAQGVAGLWRAVWRRVIAS